jgi:hypothetical protein
MNILQKRKMNSRLVRAAATEKTSSLSPPSGVEASSRRKVRLSASWRRNRGWGNKQSGDSVSEGGTTTTTCETREGNDDDFFRRFHVTVVKTRTESTTPPEPNVVAAQSDIMLLREPAEKKSVRFHKYDEVWNGGPREFVYSLYDREQHEETERDLTDDFDDAVGNVSHFFRCIKEGIEDVTTSKKSQHRRSPSPPPSSRSSSEPDDDEGSYESYQSYTDDEEDDSEIEESSLSTHGNS